jgi:hypothetical protein
VLTCRAALFGGALTLPDDDEEGDDYVSNRGNSSSRSRSRGGGRTTSGIGGGGLSALLAATLAPAGGGLFAPPRQHQQRWFQQHQQQAAAEQQQQEQEQELQHQQQEQQQAHPVPLARDELRQLLSSGAASLAPLPEARALLGDDAARTALPPAARSALLMASQQMRAEPAAVLCISPALLADAGGNGSSSSGSGSSSVMPVYALLALTAAGRSSSSATSLVPLDVASGAALTAVASALTGAGASALGFLGRGSTTTTNPTNTRAADLLSAFLGNSTSTSTTTTTALPPPVIATSSAAAWVRVGRSAAPDALARRERAARVEAAAVTRAIVACADVPSVQSLVEANWAALDAIHVGAAYVQLARLHRSGAAATAATATHAAADASSSAADAASYDGVFLSSLAQLAEHHLPQMQPRQVSSVLWATAALGRGAPGGRAGGRAWVRRMAEGARDRFFARGMGPQAFANTLWALATLRVHPGADWMDAFFEASLPQLGRFDARELSTTLWALAALQRRGRVEMTTVGGGDDDHDASSSSSSAPVLLRRSSPLFRAWIAAALRSFAARMATARPQALSNAAWALASLGVRPPRLWMSAFRYYSGLYGLEGGAGYEDGLSYTPQGMANLLWAHAVLSTSAAPASEATVADADAAATTQHQQQQPKKKDARESAAWLARVEAALARNSTALQHFTPQALACVLWGLVAAGGRPSPRLLQAWVTAATPCAACMSPTAAASVFWALSRPACCHVAGGAADDEQGHESASIDGALCAGLLHALSSSSSSSRGVRALPARVVAQLAGAVAALRVRDGPGRSRPLAAALPPETAAALAQASLAVLPALGARTLARTGLAMAAVSRDVTGGGPLLGLGWVRGFLAAASRRAGSRLGSGSGSGGSNGSSSSPPPDALCYAELARASAALLREAQRANDDQPLPLPDGWLSALVAASCAALAEAEAAAVEREEDEGASQAAAAAILEAIAEMPASGAETYHLDALREYAGGSS